MDKVVISCGEHIHHDAVWLIEGIHPDLLLCLGCIINIVEDRHELMIRKRLVLAELLSVLCSNKKKYNLVNLFVSNSVVPAKLLHLLLEVIYGNNEDDQYVNLAIEVSVKVVMLIKCDEFSLSYMTEILQKLSDVNDTKYLLPLLTLTGKLVHLMPLLCNCLLETHRDVIDLMLNCLDCQLDSAQSSCIYIFVQLMSSCTLWTDSISTKQLACLIDALITIINVVQPGDLLKNSLALLRLLVSENSCIPVLYESFVSHHADQSVSLCSTFKRLILMSKEPSIQISCIQCIICSLSHCCPESTALVANKLFSSELPEFLFEALNTTNNLLVESILRCIELLMDYPMFYVKRRIIYGLEPISRVAESLFRNVEDDYSSLRLCLSIIKNLIKNGDCCILFAGSVFIKITDLVKIGLTHTRCYVDSCQLLCSILRKEFFGNLFMFPNLLEMNNLCVDSLRMIKSRSCDRINGLDDESWCKCIESALISLSSTLKLMIDCEEDAISISPESGEEQQLLNQSARETFFAFVFKSIDEVFFPIIKELQSSTDNIVKVYDCLYATSSSVYQLSSFQRAGHPTKFSIYAIKCGFVSALWNARETNVEDSNIMSSFVKNSNEYLKMLLRNLIFSDDPREDYQHMICVGANNFPVSWNDALMLLQTRSEHEQTTSIQFTTLCLCYFTIVHNFSIVVPCDLHRILQAYLMLNEDVDRILSFKYILYMYCLGFSAVHGKDSRVMYTITEADTILMNLLSIHSGFTSAIYIHHPSILVWSSYFPDASSVLIECWLDHMDVDGKNEDLVFFINLMSENIRMLDVFVDILLNRSSLASRKASSVIEFLSSKCNEVESRFLSSVHAYVQLKMRTHDELQKLRVVNRHQDSSSQDGGLNRLLNLLCVLQSSCSNVTRQLEEVDVKLIYQLGQYVVDGNSNDESVTWCLKYLNVSIVKMDENYQKRQLLSSLLSTEGFINYLSETVEKYDGCPTDILELSLSTLNELIYHRIKYPDPLKRQRKIVINIEKLMALLRCDDVHIQAEALRLLQTILRQTSSPDATTNRIVAFDGTITCNQYLNRYLIQLYDVIFEMNILTEPVAIDCVSLLFKLSPHDKVDEMLKLPWIGHVLRSRIDASVHLQRNTVDLLQNFLDADVHNPTLTPIIDDIVNLIADSEERQAYIVKLMGDIRRSVYFEHLSESRRQDVLKFLNGTDE